MARALKGEGRPGALVGSVVKTLKGNATFEEWMKAVDREVEKRVGLSYQDLPDQPFRDWYEDFVSARTAAVRTIKSARADA